MVEPNQGQRSKPTTSVWKEELGFMVLTPPIAQVYDSIVCCYTELGETQMSFDYLDKAFGIHTSHGTGDARTTFIQSMNCLRAGKSDDALRSLQRCWNLQGLVEEQVAQSRYPNHSGDLVLLSRIELSKGNKEATLQLASRTISIRKGILGNKGPRVADSMLAVAELLRNNLKEAVAAKLLKEIIEMGQGNVEMQGHVARASWVLGQLEGSFGNDDEAKKLKSYAQEVRRLKKILMQLSTNWCLGCCREE